MNELSTASDVVARDIAEKFLCVIYENLMTEYSVEMADRVIQEIINVLTGDQR